MILSKKDSIIFVFCVFCIFGNIEDFATSFANRLRAVSDSNAIYNNMYNNIGVIRGR